MSVKEAVLPFDRFPGVDTLLGPEMRSTGEVMGIGSTFGLAFAKSQIAAGTRLPSEGTVFLSLADRDKAGGLEAARTFDELGFDLAGHVGDGRLPRVQRRARGHGGGQGGGVGRVRRRGPHRLGPRPAGGEHAAGPWPRADGVHIRSAALAHQVPCLTTVAAARAAAAGIADWQRHGLSVVCLQEVHG